MGIQHPPTPIFDNICTLPLLSSDISTQALHPTQPILAVGLSRGHVQAYRLPPSPSSQPPLSSSSSKNGLGRRTSETGFDIIDTAWRTRRHKGACRALAFSADGEKLYSAGTDGVVKVADSEMGRVTSKFNLPQYSHHTFDTPTVLATLSPQALLLGTDYGSIHVYDIRENTPFARPAQSLRPHHDAESTTAAADESITSLTLLPPSAESTSGTARMWISTSLNTLACADLRKGVVKLSADQGDLCLSSACVGNTGGVGKRKMTGSSAGAGEKVIVGSEGVLTIWERGAWGDQSGRIQLSTAGQEGTVDALAAVPEDVLVHGRSGAGVVVAGLGNGMIQFVRVRGRGGEVLGTLGHDELTFEGVTTLGFDVTGRMVSGGGQIVKVWHEKREGEGGEEEEEDAVEGEEEIQMGDGSEEDSEDDSSDDEAPKQNAKKRRKNKAAGSKHGAHGVLAFDMD